MVDKWVDLLRLTMIGNLTMQELDEPEREGRKKVLVISTQRRNRTNR